MRVLALMCFLLLPGIAGAQAPASFQTHHETIPNFAQNPTIRSAASAGWSSPSTWNLGRLPGPLDIVLISHTVTYDSMTGDADVVGIGAGGTLRFSTSTGTRLRVGTLLVMPNGALEVGTPAVPIPAGVNFELFYVQAGNAPCTMTRPDVSDGYVCATPRVAAACSSTPSPPGIPSPPANLRLSQP